VADLLPRLAAENLIHTRRLGFRTQLLKNYSNASVMQIVGLSNKTRGFPGQAITEIFRK
jgi:hypothetical protein